MQASSADVKASSFLARPLGLVLSGGGALGAWQAAALLELERAGLAFDSVLGFSAGSLNGAAYSLGIMDQAVSRWSLLKNVLRFSPRFKPLSLFSQAPVWQSISYAHDDEQARRQARCRLVIPSARWQRDKVIYAEFDSKQGRWDGPLSSHLLASCAIPGVFPPVDLEFRGDAMRLFDGGVRCGQAFSFTSLGDCADVLVLEMVRPDEMGRRPSGLFGYVNQRSREACRSLIDEGAASWSGHPKPPRLFRLAPSRPLGFSMLDFSSGKIAPALSLGAADARAFLARPQAFLG